MIKALIIDIDGVIVGKDIGFNFPDPHPEVIQRLKDIEAKGIQISLCTAKPHFAIAKIIKNANLHSLHITDGGAVIIDPLDDIILKNQTLDKSVVKQVVQTLVDRGTYTEIYSVSEYFAQTSQKTAITDMHSDVLQYEPHLVDSLEDETSRQDIVKIIAIANNDEDMHELDALLSSYDGNTTVSWTSHPVALPRRFGVVTAKGISKRQAAIEIASHNGVELEELLGIGDSTSDWQFIEKCGYAGAMGNASTELKELITSKGEQSFVGGPVDYNGILDIFDYFKL